MFVVLFVRSLGRMRTVAACLFEFQTTNNNCCWLVVLSARPLPLAARPLPLVARRSTFLRACRLLFTLRVGVLPYTKAKVVIIRIVEHELARRNGDVPRVSRCSFRNAVIPSWSLIRAIDSHKLILVKTRERIGVRLGRFVKCIELYISRWSGN